MNFTKDRSRCTVILVALLTTYLACSTSGEDRCDRAIGITDKTLFPKKMFSAKHGGQPELARLNIKAIGWCPTDPLIARRKRNQYIQIDLGQLYRLEAIVTQGSGESGKAQQRFAKSYKIMFKRHSTAAWETIRDNSSKIETIFVGNTNNIALVKRSFTKVSPYPLYASAIRVIPWEYAKDNACLKVELLGCKVSTLKYLKCHKDAECDDKAKCNKYKFECECIGNYTGNGVFCADIDECSSTTHSCKKEEGEKCENFGGGYSCICMDGFIKRGDKCKDVNECAMKSGKSAVCGPPKAGDCKNNKGGYACSCRKGYKSLSSHNKGPCVDNDECKEGTHDCGKIQNSYCFNLNGSYACKCKEGFKMSGSTCEETGLLAALVSIAPYLGGIFGLVILSLIPIIVVMIRRWKRVRKEEQELMMASLDPTIETYVGGDDSGWSVGVDEDELLY